MKYALTVSGVLAGVVWLAPGLVVVGYLFLIIPGLILSVSPTVFVYLTLVAVIRRSLPLESAIGSTLIASGLAILMGWSVMQPFRAAALREYQASQLPDVQPGHPVKIRGHIRLEFPDDRRVPQCDYLCLALLDTPGVESVTVVTTGKSGGPDQRVTAAYALRTEAADSPAGLFPHEPGQIVRHDPKQAKTHTGRNFQTAIKAVEADWALRLGGQERLRKVRPVEAPQADWDVRIDNRSTYRVSALRRTTITDSDGAVQFRKSY